MPSSMRDLIVIVPGIGGSTLLKDGEEIWGVSRAINNIFSLSEAIQSLTLESGVGHNSPEDGVTAGPLIPGLSMIPTLFKVDGYGHLRDFLRTHFTLTSPTKESAGNFVEFGYDWRLSNQLTAKRLADVVIHELARWRKQSGNQDAKLILICHSMGGLVARWFLEGLGHRDLARTLITIGTPYQGAVKALEALVNGLSIVGIQLTDLVRSFPSVYQLLPTYPCLDIGNGEVQKLGTFDLPNINSGNVGEGLAFHGRLTANFVSPSPYRIFAIKGIEQPTAQSAQFSDGKIQILTNYHGQDYSGDGTVARTSSHPPEWQDDSGSAFVSQRHTLLQSTDSVLTQIQGILTAGQLPRFMGANQLSLDLPDIIQVGEPLQIFVRSVAGEDRLALAVTCICENGDVFKEGEIMRPLGKAKYALTISNLPRGAYKITVESGAPAVAVDPVSDWILVWSSQAENAGTI